MGSQHSGAQYAENSNAIEVRNDQNSPDILQRQTSLNRIEGIEKELADTTGFFERRKRIRLLDERNKLLAQLRSDANMLRTRLDEARQRRLEAKNAKSILEWFTATRQGDTLLNAECQELEEQLRQVRAALEELGDAEDTCDMAAGEVEMAMKCLEPVQEGSTTWDAIVKLVNENSEKHTCHYHYQMAIKSIWRVPAGPEFRQMEEVAKRLGRPTTLFHGTSVENAARIVKNGFQLPRRHAHGGMFGKGIYFAKTPLKSVNYTRKEGVVSRFKGWLFSDPKSKGGLQMLLCDVYLGRTRTLTGARPQFDPDVDLKGGTFSNMFGLGDYNSVYVPGGGFGIAALFRAVNVTEYVVYEPHQAIPRYLIEFERRRQ